MFGAAGRAECYGRDVGCCTDAIFGAARTRCYGVKSVLQDVLKNYFNFDESGTNMPMPISQQQHDLLERYDLSGSGGENGSGLGADVALALSS